ncbi:hypothetical protein O6H91_04G044700 [Diphasiastrum complanatum]|uniref:Uncharacterized protein n=1 Tax=Diphasiastrum complanatum TaxID=34168 RepID=A0ACC2DWD7_DIPCM|nr:hypothetical protein O6H91_04G044700 [Diphasiastrum complanatum]
MARLFKDPKQISAYKDRRFSGSDRDFQEKLRESSTVYVGNLSFYTTEEQMYEVFSRCGDIKKIIMGLDKNSKTPCGFGFVLFYTREDTEDAVKYVSGTILDDRPIRVDFDWGFENGRQWGRGRSGGQVRDEYRTDYDPGRGGYGKLVQKELESRRLVEYTDSSVLGAISSYPTSFQTPRYSAAQGSHGGSHRGSRDGGRKRHREQETISADAVMRSADREPRPEKNPRFREKGDSDEEEAGKP